MTVTLTRGELTFVFRKVPALICRDCSEEYLTEETSILLLQIANESFNKGESNFKDLSVDSPSVKS